MAQEHVHIAHAEDILMIMRKPLVNIAGKVLINLMKIHQDVYQQTKVTM